MEMLTELFKFYPERGIFQPITALFLKFVVIVFPFLTLAATVTVIRNLRKIWRKDP